MPEYQRGDPPQNTADVLRFLREELQRIESYTQRPTVNGIRLQEHTVEPRAEEKLIVFADGTSWDPGGGRGVYIYLDGAWVEFCLCTSG